LSGPKATFFESAAALRRWLEAHHASEAELLVGFFKRGSGRPSLTWPESVDEALCFGWIDGIRRTVDEERYTIRFTPRRPGSNWSAVNLKRVPQLEALGRMADAGRAAFAKRSEAKSAIYSYENKPEDLPPDDQKRFRANKKAWKFFSEQPPGYRRTALYWVLSAKKEELIADSAAGRRLPQLTPTPRRKR
jgi:uncharacterized protein YdeI (YjbR/CyaY-like superfamily)